VASRIQVDLGGPIFSGQDRPIIRAAFKDAKQTLAKWGQDQVQALARKKPKHPKGRFADSITIFDYKKGLTIAPDYPQVLYGPWLEGVSARNETTRFKGYRMFKLVRGRMKKQMTELVQGRFARAVDELNGGPAE
jgi:hypothetical protein